MLKFEHCIKPESIDIVLDVGGDPRTWVIRPQLTKKIDCLNVNHSTWDASDYPSHRINIIEEDGCAIEHTDKSYNIVYSNSVIEHVGDSEA